VDRINALGLRAIPVMSREQVMHLVNELSSSRQFPELDNMTLKEAFESGRFAIYFGKE
jgi:hypothetical protein